MTSEISVQGFADGAYDGVRAVFEENLATGRDVGASFCVTVGGHTVVDVWGGFADDGRSRPWLQDTIVGVYSTTKTVTSLTAEIPAIGGIGNARSLAKLHAVLATGGMAGDRRIMSEAGCRKALESQVDGRDLILDIPIRFGLGFAIGTGMPNANTLYWGGYGGSLVIVDLDAGMTLAYTMNKMTGTTTGDERSLGLAFAAWEAMAA